MADRDTLAEKVVVLTGASSGLGKGAARKLAEGGASLVLAARRSALLEELAGECQTLGGRAVAVPTDVSVAEEVTRLLDAALARFGHVDAWINDAGVSTIGPFEDVPLEHHHQVVATNLMGTISGSHAAMRHFKQRRRGTLINIASGLGKIPTPYYASYVASKFGVVGFCDSLRQELSLAGLKDIHVATVLPMAMDTTFFDHAGNFTGKEPQPVGPLYDPQLVIDQLAELVIHPKNEEVIVGPAGKMYNVLHHAFPGMVEAIMARRARKDQFQGVADAPFDDGAVLTPNAEGTGVKGGRLEE